MSSKKPGPQGSQGSQAEKPKEQTLKKRSDLPVLKYDKYSYANFFRFDK